MQYSLKPAQASARPRKFLTRRIELTPSRSYYKIRYRWWRIADLDVHPIAVTFMRRDDRDGPRRHPRHRA